MSLEKCWHWSAPDSPSADVSDMAVDGGTSGVAGRNGVGDVGGVSGGVASGINAPRDGS